MTSVAQISRPKSESRQRRALVGVRLLPGEHAEVQKIASETGTSAAGVLRAALEQYLKRPLTETANG